MYIFSPKTKILLCTHDCLLTGARRSGDGSQQQGSICSSIESNAIKIDVQHSNIGSVNGRDQKEEKKNRGLFMTCALELEPWVQPQNCSLLYENNNNNDNFVIHTKSMTKYSRTCEQFRPIPTRIFSHKRK